MLGYKKATMRSNYFNITATNFFLPLFYSRCCIVGSWMCFSLMKTFQFSSKRLLQFSLTEGELQTFKLYAGMSL